MAIECIVDNYRIVALMIELVLLLIYVIPLALQL